MSPHARVPLARVPLVLASASPARLATLRAAGVSPVVRVSSVDEDAELAAALERAADLTPADVALLLARAKAEDVTAALEAAGEPGRLVLGCDSVLELAGERHRKPRTRTQAVRRWKRMRGQTGVLHTGHWLVDDRGADEGGTAGAVGATASTTVHFAELDDEEVEAYVATGEPLRVAGGFTLDGLGGAFVRAIEGDPGTVVGLSLPLLRELLGDVGVRWFDIVAPPG
ncbi:MAG TPA: Maf family protein [Dermatophilaceae bacterium]|nr:Maf family protein [Dermatophilaceae bacterium]